VVVVPGHETSHRRPVGQGTEPSIIIVIPLLLELDELVPNPLLEPPPLIPPLTPPLVALLLLPPSSVPPGKPSLCVDAAHPEVEPPPMTIDPPNTRASVDHRAIFFSASLAVGEHSPAGLTTLPACRRVG
jgi:hypothetical protein